MREKKRAAKKATLSKADLLKREKAIIADIKAGVLSYREIALKHHVSLPTVNNKARKAGISRGRRKGAKIVVPRPARKVRKAGRKKAVRKTAKKAARRPRRRVKAAPVTPAIKATKRRRARKPAARRRVVRRARKAAAPGASKFAGAFRQLVLKHFPKISLVKFDRLARLVEHETR
jgi:hypothetical protein